MHEGGSGLSRFRANDAPMRKDKAAMSHASSETQGQLVGAGKSLNGRGKKSGEEKSRTNITHPRRPRGS